MKTINLILIVALVTTVACSNRALAPEEFIKWVENEDNGLITKTTKGEYNFQIQYKPLEYMVLKSLSNPNSIDKETFDEFLDRPDELQYYTFRISLSETFGDLLKYKVESEKEYLKRLEYFSYSIQSDLKIIEGEKELSCVLTHFERTFGLTSYIVLTLAFETNNVENKEAESKKITRDKVFRYDDKILGVGTVELTINAKDINRLPDLLI